jgi:hypothetical protein
MPHWEYHINIADVWRNDALTFEQRSDAIVARVRANRWFSERNQGGFDELGDVVSNLADAADANEFDEWWSELYDQADRDRAWIATI